MLALILGLLALGTAEAGRTPDVDAAEELVDQLIDHVLNGEVPVPWFRRHVETVLPFERVSSEQQDAENNRLYGRLAPGGDLYKSLVRSSSIYGSVEGPDYVRVVLEGGDWMTVLVDARNGRPQVRGFEQSSCGLCSEPERFLQDLIREVELTGDASHRLLPGVEMVVSSVHPENEWKRERWIWAYVNRAAGSNYTTRVLRGAEVLGSRGRSVHLRLEAGEEAWPLVYLRGRWWVDYGALSEQSVLRLGETVSESWTRIDTVRSARLSAWRPDWRHHAGAVQVSGGALFFAPRGIQEDVLLYDQDMGRRWAMWALLDSREGRVRAKMDAPRLSRRMFVDTMGWPELFRFDLAPNGQQLAVASHNRAWVFDLPEASVVWEQRDLSGAGGTAFSPNGSQLAVLDRAYGTIRVLDTNGFTVLSQARGPRDALGMDWTAEGLWILGQDALHFLKNGENRTAEVASFDCSEGVPSQAVVQSFSETWVHCPGRRSVIHRFSHQAPQEDDVLLRLPGRRKSGTFAVSENGQWMVVPARQDQEEGMCLVEVANEEAVTCFSTLPLRSAAFDESNRYLYGIDQRGRAWQWRLSQLIEKTR